jgi:DNA-binding MarR family transcriptional regulator
MLKMKHTEKLTLYGIVNYPDLNDKQLSEKLNLKHSTLTSIRNRLRKNEYYRTIVIPRLQNMGCKMLVVIYTNFSPLIPLEERVKITGETIEIFEEIFFSVGEQDKGFSISLSKDYATIARINDIRTQTFGGRGLLEEERPKMIVFPFEISRVYRFFDFAPLLNSCFNLNFVLNENSKDIAFRTIDDISLQDTEKNVYCMLVKYPEMSDTEIAENVGVSRHTVSRLKRKFEDRKLIRKINLPDIKKMGFEILTFYHIKFDPSNPPDIDKDEASILMSSSTIFMASRQFEAILLTIHRDYDDYANDKNRIMHILKENKWIAEKTLIQTYSLNSLVFIKNFKFAPIAMKMVGSDFLI